MKKILIITDWFAPENEIASVRTTKLAKYLSMSGYNISVVTKVADLKIKDSLLEQDMEYVHELIRIDRDKFFKLASSFNMNLRLFLSKKSKNNKKSENKEQIEIISVSPTFLENLRRIISFFIKRICDHFFSKKVVSALNGIDYDIVISTYGDFSPHLIASRLKANRKSKFKWIADFRDPVYSGFQLKFLKLFLRKYFNKVSKKADAITAVSQGIFEIHKNDTTQEGHVITNGYDTDDIKSIIPFDFKNQKINFVYTGALYAGRSDFSPVFNAIHDFIETGVFDINDLAVHYAGKDFRALKKQASNFGMEPILYDHGFVPREQSLSMQSGADILLLASWNCTGYTGVITGKFLEYMMIDKPILSIITGNIPNSEIKKIMQKANNGFCYEQAMRDTDNEKLKDFLLAAYKEFKNGGFIKLNPNKEYIEKFNYKNIAKQFESLF